METILLVDDNPANLSVLATMLENVGYTILIARDGVGAIKTAAYAQPDIILLDVLMPGIDGYETCRRLKKNSATKEIPVIFMTALDHTKNKIEGFAAGAVDYITKPVRHEEVMARVSTHLRLQTQTRYLQRLTLQQEISLQVAQQATSILDLDQLLTAVVHLIQTQFGYFYVTAWLFSEGKDALTLKAASGHPLPKDVSIGMEVPLKEAPPVITAVIQTNSDFLYQKITEPNPKTVGNLPETISEIALPLRIGHEIIGILDIQNDQNHAFQEEDSNVLQSLAYQIAIAIRNAQLYSNQKNLRRLETQKVDELAELNASKDKFFAIISHDLRAPFNSLLTLSQLLFLGFGTKTEAETKQIAGRIYNSAKTTYVLLQNLLAWAMMQSGRMIFTPAIINLHEVVQSSFTLWDDLIEEKDIQLINQIAPQLEVFTDKNMLEMIIRNLISNSIKFSFSGGAVIVTAQLDHDLANSQANPNNTSKKVKITVTDSGVGISQENMGTIFNKHSHYTTPGTQDEAGAGLGLILCQDMLETQGEGLHVQSKLNEGTSMWFFVPKATVAQ